MPGRTLMQQALPITFAYKAAVWLSGLTGAAERLRWVEANALALQFGGAAGTLPQYQTCPCLIGPPTSKPKSLMFWIGAPEPAPCARISSVTLSASNLSLVL